MIRKIILVANVFSIFFVSYESLANIVGVGSQNFNSIPSGLDFVTVHSSETLKPGIVNLGVYLNYAINTLPYFDNTETSRLSFKDGLLSGDLNFGLGIWPGVEVGASLPVLLGQNKSDSGFRGEFSSAGITEFRWLAKTRVWGNDSQGLGFVLSSNINLIRNDPMAGENSGPTFNFELVGDKTFGPVSIGANLGFRKRNPGSAIAGFPIEPLRNQIIASVAASYYISSWDTKIVSEIFTGFPTGNQIDLSSRNNSAAELLVGLKHNFSHDISGHAGMGTELVHARSSPDWRIYSGLNYTFGATRSSKFYSYEDQDVEVLVVSNIQFKFDSDEMTTDSQESVEQLVKKLKSSRAFKELSIEGHTDSIGPEQYNAALSLRRAEAIKNYLVLVHGYEKEKIITKGVGEDKPVADNGNFQGRQANRRVEFKITR